jgi:protein involved in polysaccharide export with SLBB domain
MLVIGNFRALPFPAPYPTNRTGKISEKIKPAKKTKSLTKVSYKIYDFRPFNSLINNKRKLSGRRLMNYRKLFQFSFILLCILFTRSLLAAQSALPETIPPDKIQAEENLIHHGDLIDVDILGSFDYDWRGRLTPEGYLDGINFVAEPIFGLCRSEEEIALTVARSYEKLLREPKVVVKIIDRSNRAISILEGAVKKQQRFQIKRKVFLNELLIVSGGLTELASGEIRIFRPQNLSCNSQTIAVENSALENGEKRERFVKTSQASGSTAINIKISELLGGNSESNPQILSGDIITVLEADPIYITGGVNSPKQISARSKITLSRAIDSAGGLAKGAMENSVTIFRRSGSETKIIEADLSKIKAEQSEDIILQGYDIIDVGEKGREKKKYPPVLQFYKSSENKTSILPLRVIE